MRRAAALVLVSALACAAAWADVSADFDAGRQAYREGRWTDALRLFEACRAASPGDATIAQWDGAVLLRLGRGSEALAVLEPVVRADPRNTAALTNVATAWRLMGSDQSAEENLRRALTVDPSYSLARANLASLLMATGRAPEAGDLWRERLSADPSDVTAHLGLAGVLEAQSRYEDALAELRGCGSGPAAAAMIAVLLVLTGDTEAGIQAFGAVSDPAPDVVERFCGALVDRGAVQEAVARLGVPSVRAGLSAYGLAVLAKALASLQRWDELGPALQDLIKTTEFQTRWRPSDKAPVYAHLAYLAAKEGDAATAHTCAEAALNLDPGQRLARWIESSGSVEDPLRALERAATQPTATIEDLKTYAVLAAGTPGYVAPPQALTVLLGVGTQDPELLARLGVILLRAGRFQEAADKLSQAADIVPGDAAVHNNLGVAYEALGRTDDAEREYAQAVRADPGSREAQANLQRVRSGRGG